MRNILKTFNVAAYNIKALVAAMISQRDLVFAQHVRICGRDWPHSGWTDLACNKFRVKLQTNICLKKNNKKKCSINPTVTDSSKPSQFGANVFAGYSSYNFNYNTVDYEPLLLVKEVTQSTLPRL